MKCNQWTLGLAAVGLVSLGAVAQAEEAQYEVMTALSSTTISGYVSTSANLRFGHGDMSPGRSYDGADKQDGFNLDVVKLQLQKPLDETDRWTAGYNIGLLFGPDANTYGTTSTKLSDIVATHAASDVWPQVAGVIGSLGSLLGGWADDSDLPDIDIGDVVAGVRDTLGRVNDPHFQAFAQGNSDFGIKEANVVLRTPVGSGLDFKIGYWENPNGYETFDAGSNPNYSRSYGYYIEPKQFTGVLATYRFSQVIQAAAGVANTGWAILPGAGGNTVLHVPMNGINSRSGLDGLLTYMGSIAITAPETAGFLKGATLYGGIIDSSVYHGPDVLNFYVGGTMRTPIENVLAGVAYDGRVNGHSGTVWNGADASTIAGYLIWNAGEKVRLNGRVEYATGSNNSWYYYSSGDRNKMLGVTATLDYNMWANVLARLEFRWDHDLTGNGMFNDPTCPDNNAYSLTLNAIYKF